MAESSVNSEKNVISTIVNITLDFIIIFQLQSSSAHFEKE